MLNDERRARNQRSLLRLRTGRGFQRQIPPFSVFTFGEVDAAQATTGCLLMVPVGPFYIWAQVSADTFSLVRCTRGSAGHNTHACTFESCYTVFAVLV